MVYEAGGTSALFDVNNTAIISAPAMPGASGGSFFSTAFDSTKFTYMLVPYPAATFPMNTSTTQGAQRLTQMINATPGPFVLIGTSQGAMVCSEVYQSLQSGALSSRLSDFKLGCMFGNPMRKAGTAFPGYQTGQAATSNPNVFQALLDAIGIKLGQAKGTSADPGGEGLLHPSLLTTVDSSVWYEFANPGDLACCNDWSTQFGKQASSCLEVANSMVPDTVPTANALASLLYDVAAGPHSQYGVWQPLGDGRPAVQVAADFISALA